MARIIAKDLKTGDICYLIGIDGDVETCTITDIRFTGKEANITFNKGVIGWCYVDSIKCSYGMFSAKVFFSKEDAIENLKDKISFIQRNIEKLRTL